LCELKKKMFMKKILATIIAIFCAVYSYAQEHLAFKGVPIDGTLSSYIAKMSAKGFVSVSSQNGVAILKGNFAAHKSCTIWVATMQNKNLVSRIAVVFPDHSQWQYLYGDYSELKELLTVKYGKPTNCIEEFPTQTGNNQESTQDITHHVATPRLKSYLKEDINLFAEEASEGLSDIYGGMGGVQKEGNSHQGYSNTTADSDKIHEVMFGRCKFGVLFLTTNGKIQLSIEKNNEYENGFVKLLYIDKINNDIVRQDILDDL